MNKTQAIETARSQVGQIYPFGEDNYKFNYWDESVNAWRESSSRGYFNAAYARSQKKINTALALLGYDQDQCFDAMASYVNGSWVEHLNDMIEKFSKTA